MKCPICESKAIVAVKQDYKPTASEGLYEIRTYVCTNMQCQHVFNYKNQPIDKKSMIDAEKFIRRYQRAHANGEQQTEMFEDDE